MRALARLALAACGAAGLLLAEPAPAVAGVARQLLEEGVGQVTARDFERAARSFAEAAARAGGDGLDPAVANYDRGIALLKSGKNVDASAAFAEAEGSPDPALRERAHFNRGIALAAEAEGSERRGEMGKALALLEEALGAYESAMRLDPDDEDPKVNHELAARRKERLAAQTRERERQRPEQRPPNREEPPPQGGTRRPPAPGREMSPEEARVLLDALRRQELSQRAQLRQPAAGSAPVERDW